MNVRILLDGIVRQTTVLIAQIATAAGGRAPVAQLANQVFLDLTQALQEQGVGRKVIADMFGLALRSYQQKVQRLTESGTDANTTLWDAIHRYIGEQKVVTRADLARRFARDDADSVAGIVRDMVESGLVYRTGRADTAVYRIAPREDLERALAGDPQGTAQALLWLAIYEGGPITRRKLKDWVRLSDAQLDAALNALHNDGRIELEADEAAGGEPRYRCDRVVIPLGETVGWEAALLDHHRAVVASICAKLRNGQTRALPSDQLGGSTFSFDVWPGHPSEARVLALLATMRTQLQALWDEVTAYNAQGKPATFKRVTFYGGQMVTDEFAEPNGESDGAEGEKA